MTRSACVTAPYRAADGNVDLVVLDGVGHADHDRLVYPSYVGRLTHDWPTLG